LAEFGWLYHDLHQKIVEDVSNDGWGCDVPHYIAVPSPLNLDPWFKAKESSWSPHWGLLRGLSKTFLKQNRFGPSVSFQLSLLVWFTSKSGYGLEVIVKLTGDSIYYVIVLPSYSFLWFPLFNLIWQNISNPRYRRPKPCFSPGTRPGSWINHATLFLEQAIVTTWSGSDKWAWF